MKKLLTLLFVAVAAIAAHATDYDVPVTVTVNDVVTEQEGIRCVKAWCAADNVGSRKVMERAGMTRVSAEKGALVIDGREYDKQNYEVLL